MSKYDDIINLERPKHEGRVIMSMDDRAKIFLPFAALKGYEEALDVTKLNNIDYYDNCEIIRSVDEEI